MKASNKYSVAIRADSIRIASSQKEAVKKVLRVIAATKGFSVDSVRKDSKGNVIMLLKKEGESEMKVRTIDWAAIRMAIDDGREFIDLDTLSSDRDHCVELAVKSSEKTGESWDAANPIVRFSQVEIKEF